MSEPVNQASSAIVEVVGQIISMRGLAELKDLEPEMEEPEMEPLWEGEEEC